MYSAPDYVVELLEKAGYSKPVAKERQSLPFPGLDVKAAEELTPYSYGVSDEEARNILETYAPGVQGDPEAITKQRVESSNRAVPLTVEAYNKLTPEQRAAVDFNTALVEAREKDLMGGWMIKVAPDADKAAEARKSAFGEDTLTGGYPEHTMRLLEKIGYKAPGTKLEDFLSLDMAVTADELKDLKLPKDIKFATEFQADDELVAAGRYQGILKDSADARKDDGWGQVRSSENLAMIELDVIRRASEALSQARTGGATPGWSPAATASRFLGVEARNTPLGWGADPGAFGDPKDRVKDADFKRVFDILQSDPTRTKLADVDEFWARLKQTGATEKDIDQLFQFLDQRTRWMIENGVKPMDGQNDAMVIRELAGLGPINGSS
jgi:hypothetical protein